MSKHSLPQPPRPRRSHMPTKKRPATIPRKLFAFPALPFELQTRVLSCWSRNADKTSRMIPLLLSKECYKSLGPLFYQYSAFRFDSLAQLLRFLNTASDFCLQKIRHTAYDFGPEARPSLNQNPPKDARRNAVQVRAFAENLIHHFDVSVLKGLKINFGKAKYIGDLVDSDVYHGFYPDQDDADDDDDYAQASLTLQMLLEI